MNEPIVASEMLQEHQGIQKIETKNASYIPNEEEKKALKLVESYFQKAKKARKAYDEKWPKYWRFFIGKQWEESRPSYRHSEVINMVFRAIQSQVPILTDAKPKIEFMPQEPQDQEIAEIMNQVLDNDWNSKNWSKKLTEVIYQAHIIGTGFGSMEFDPSLEDGLGAIVFKSFDPFWFFPEAGEPEINEGASSLITAEPICLNKLKYQYKDKAQYLKPDVMELDRPSKIDTDQVRYKSPTDNKTILEGSSPFDLSSRDQALKVTLWLKDDEYIEEKITSTDPEGNQIDAYQQKLKYPNGRKICVSSGVVLDDTGNPYEDGKFPYAKLTNFLIPNEFWGMSEVEQIISPQKIFNKLVSFSLDVLTMMGNPIFVVDTTAGIDTDNLTNRPGLIVEKEPGSEVRREAGVDINPSVFRLIENMKLWFDDVSGSNDVSRGANPSGVTAASAITALQESAQTRIRQKSKHIDSFLQDLGQLYLSRALQFYTSPRIIRLTNNQNAQGYFKFHVSTEDGKKYINVTNLVQNEHGQTFEDISKKIPLSGSLDIKVTTGSGLPFSKKEKFMTASELFKMGVIDAEELLKAADYPNWEAVMNRMNQQQQQMAAAPQQGMPAGGING